MTELSEALAVLDQAIAVLEDAVIDADPGFGRWHMDVSYSQYNGKRQFQTANVVGTDMHDIATLDGWDVPPPSRADEDITESAILTSTEQEEWLSAREQQASADARYISLMDPVVGAKLLAVLKRYRFKMFRNSFEQGTDVLDAFPAMVELARAIVRAQ